MKIGIYRGKEISEMSRDELLEFAIWSSKQIEKYMVMEMDTQDFRLNKEVLDLLPSLQEKETKRMSFIHTLLGGSSPNQSKKP